MRNDRLLFEQLEISLDAGQMLVVEGPNGCGKTSLLRILTGLRMADGGEILWRGEPIDRLAGDYFEQVNYVVHHDGVKHELSCLENLRLARAMGAPSSIDLDDASISAHVHGDAVLRVTRHGGEINRDTRTASFRFDKIEGDWRIISVNVSARQQAQ